MKNDKETVYKKAKLGGKIGFGKRPAVIVIDYQKGFTLTNSPVGGDMTNQVMNTVKMINAARNKEVKIIFTRLGYNKDGSDLTIFGKKAPVLKEFVRDHWYYDWDERLDIRENDITIEKHWPSVFFGTHLVQMLIAMRIDTVILCGCTVGGCVYASAIDSCSYGFKTVVAADASADRSQEIYDVFLWNMGQKYADIMTTDEIINEFKTLNKLEYDLHY